ncbi:MAG: nucleotidyltransferase [Helicobacteraceae bacterium]|nr:nucleotidyltransferase [Helicobacteraceae bacterium]
MITKDQVLEYLTQYKKKYSEEYHFVKLGLFGSIVRGENNPKSDLDVVVEFSKPNLFVQAGIMEDLKEKFKINVDVIALSKHTNLKLLRRINRDVIYV